MSGMDWKSQEKVYKAMHVEPVWIPVRELCSDFVMDPSKSGLWSETKGGYFRLYTEDGGHTKILEITDGGDEGPYVVLHSWSNQDPPVHSQLDKLIGKRVRIIVEFTEVADAGPH